MNDGPLSCAHCGHDIEQHHPSPGEYRRGIDHCHGQRATALTTNGRELERHERSGTPCQCDGFAIAREEEMA